MFPRKLWMIAMIVWFGLYAIFNLTNITVVFANVIMGIIAAIVCILMIFDK